MMVVLVGKVLSVVEDNWGHGDYGHQVIIVRGRIFFLCVGVCELERVILFFWYFSISIFFFFVMASHKIPLLLAKQIYPFSPNCLVPKQLKKYWSLIFLFSFFALLVLLSNIFSCILIFLKKIMSMSTRWEKLINYFEINM